jgi:hypothetical protein
MGTSILQNVSFYIIFFLFFFFFLVFCLERGVSSISVCHLVDEGGVEAFLQMGGVRRYGKEGERGESIYDDAQHPPCFGGGFLSSMTVGSFVEAGRTGGVFGSFLAEDKS